MGIMCRSFVVCGIVFLSLAASSGAPQAGLVARWSFEGSGPAIARDDVGGITDTIEGTHKQPRGIVGSGLKLDGYTTCIVRNSSQAPRLTGDMAAGAWVAFAAHPWNWCPIITQSNANEKGFSLTAGPRGQVRFEICVEDTWQRCTSRDFAIPLRQWVYVVGVYDEKKGLCVYVDGQLARSEATTGSPQYADDSDLRLGMNYEATKPSNIHREHGTLPSWFSIDGIMDEVKLYNKAPTASDIAAQFQSTLPLPKPVLQPRVLPAGPKGPGRFGAYYCYLKYYDEWDNLWPVGSDPDILVRFDTSSARVVFWRGTRYSPAWVAEPGLWMADQSTETWRTGANDTEGCYEHMQDFRCRYSHVRIIENHDARVVVHWRYPLVSVHDHIWQEDPKTHRACWADEYYFIYPDVMGVRKVSWKTGTLGGPHEFQESLPLTGPGQLQADVIHLDYAFVANLKGQTQTLSFVPDPSAQRPENHWRFLPKKNGKSIPEDLTIQMFNFRSEFKPFNVFEPGNRMHYVTDLVLEPGGLTVPSGCNHWPVGQMRCDGRAVQAADRPTHFLGCPMSSPPVHEKDGRSWWNALYGMTDKPIEELVAVARSYSQAPQMSVQGDGFTGGDYDRSERIYRVDCADPKAASVLRCRLVASVESPICNVPIIITNWGEAGAILKIDGLPTKQGKSFRLGHRYDPERTDLVIWIRLQSTKPVDLELARASVIP